MKKFICTFIMMIVLSVSMIAQNVPQGMNYQAVARDDNGLVLADQDINLRVTLLSQAEGEQQIKEYVEMHSVQTNKLGLFNIIIGEGSKPDGDFKNIPWSTKDIWMELAIDMRGGEDFVTLDQTRLLAVPYAFHAATASEVVGEEASPNSRFPKEKREWLTDGNELIGERNKLGTVDEGPLIIVTNDVERMRIHPNGGILMMQELMMKGHLITTGHAEIYGDLDLGSSLTVAGDINAGGSMVVSGEGAFNDLEIKNNLDVGNDINTGRDLMVDRNLEIGEKTYLAGNVGIGVQPNNFYILSVLGDMSLDGNLQLNGLLEVEEGMKVSANTEEHVVTFTNENQGSGDGIAIQLAKLKTSSENNFITFYNGSGGVTGRIEGFDLSHDLLDDFPLPTNAALKDIACVLASHYNPLVGTADVLGFGFNEFADFWNEDAEIPEVYLVDIPKLAVPYIPITPKVNLPSPLPDIPAVNFPGYTLTNGFPIKWPAFDFSDKLFEIPHIPLIQDVATSEFGCPVVPYNPEYSDFDIYYPNVSSWFNDMLGWTFTRGVYELAGFSIPELISKAVLLEEVSILKDGGVTYGSKGADYAEYLPKLNPEEIFLPGEIIGVFGGKISKKTENADQVLAISSMPLVLGNQPEKGEEMNFEKVGFLGQVPVFVKGSVNIGDFILPSGLDNGIGRAVAPQDILLSEIPQVIGRAWSSSPDVSLNLINVSIGMKPAEFVPILQKQADRLDAIEAQLEAIIN